MPNSIVYDTQLKQVLALKTSIVYYNKEYFITKSKYIIRQFDGAFQILVDNWKTKTHALKRRHLGILKKT